MTQVESHMLRERKQPKEEDSAQRLSGDDGEASTIHEDAPFIAAVKAPVLYRDCFVSLTAAELTIYSYYFPGFRRKIPVHQILRAATMRELGLNWWHTKTNGIGLDPQTWWALDWRRNVPGLEPHKHVVIFVRDECMRKGFSVEDRPRFLAALLPLLPPADETEPTAHRAT
ncbi:hypothetical protein THASP1DRAFT_30169 [Thamnocephalis sphaerospora]|uniref:Uncharacterized protein n=1 Tax=Thamnocephalis sphaerospora TaxID=78915 RepID=A0A4P9XPT1_9FUNG|nr:hypothetical protein THASP1DRAFT_30169 [Thamnocephalis sphaerospora]|eukprot:RKP08016.1 hypothetical protein THASP1DRAFT_30169 [Thamnocephalis sphaerospora]